MAGLKKIVLLAVALFTLYFAGQQLGILAGERLFSLQGWNSLERLAAIDAEYGVGPEQPMPATNFLDSYTEKLRSLQPRTDDEKKVISLKFELAELAKGLAAVSGLDAKLGAEGGCANGTQLEVAINNAAAHARKAKETSGSMGTVKGFEYLTGSAFNSGIDSAIASLDGTRNRFMVLC